MNEPEIIKIFAIDPRVEVGDEELTMMIDGRRASPWAMSRPDYYDRSSVAVGDFDYKELDRESERRKFFRRVSRKALGLPNNEESMSSPNVKILGKSSSEDTSTSLNS